MDLINILLILVVISVALFDFTNGFHDAADMVATAIASRAMTAFSAIVVVSVFTFLGPLVVGLAVADTVGNFVEIKGASAHVGESVVIAALLAAVSYNLGNWGCLPLLPIPWRADWWARACRRLAPVISTGVSKRSPMADWSV